MQVRTRTLVINGVATPAQAGSADISATHLGVTGSSTLKVSSATLKSIQLTPASPAVAAGASIQLVATGVYSDGATYELTNFVTWLSSSPAVAVVSNASGSRGLATGLSSGSTSITAVFEAVTSTSDTLAVSP